jgi:hypothetical protein
MIRSPQERRFGIFAPVALGAMLALTSLAIVRAEHAAPDARGGANKVFKCSTGEACVAGQSSGNAIYAVAGSSTTGSGVLGSTSSNGAVVGVFGSTTGYYGQNVGVYGLSYGSAAVYGYQPNARDPYTLGAVEGDSPYAAGIFGNSDDIGNGVTAESTKGTALYAESGPGEEAYGNGNPTVSIVSDTGDSPMLYAYSRYFNDYCYITVAATLYCSTSVQAGKSLEARHRTSSGRHVEAFAAQTTTQTIEDFGNARMLDGAANVMIPSDFASVIEHSSDYYVFLTPLGETRGLYVSLKTSSGFQVRENERGRTNVAFDYRIVARPIDASADRLPPAPRFRRPHIAAALPRPQLPPVPKLTH